MMKLPRLKNDSDAGDPLIMYLIDPVHLERYENILPGSAEQLFKETKKQLSHKRLFRWACLCVRLTGALIGLSAMSNVLVKVLHEVMSGL